MLDLYVYWTDMDKLQKFIQVRKSILNSVKHLVGSESGRKALIKSDGIAILYATAKQVAAKYRTRTDNGFIITWHVYSHVTRVLSRDMYTVTWHARYHVTCIQSRDMRAITWHVYSHVICALSRDMYTVTWYACYHVTCIQSRDTRAITWHVYSHVTCCNKLINPAVLLLFRLSSCFVRFQRLALIFLVYH